ncbi:MAG TPA: NAD-dependent epimerase/dehydratase family protein [Terriglobales bacterium]|jgi:UDP-glucose 4-epimerase
MRILVTGGAGFIASHVADAYIEAGHEVAILDDLSRGHHRNIHSKAQFFQGDIQDRNFVSQTFAEFRPQVVNHHAAQMDVRRGVREPIFDARVNILGSINLLEEAIAHKIQHIIYASSAGAGYGEPDKFPVVEDYPINPITPYGISKHTMEHYLFTFSHLYGFSYVVLRYGNVYGPRQSSQGEAGVFAIFCEQMLEDVQPVLYGDGSKTRDYVYVQDVAVANVAALNKGHGEIFNIGTGVPTMDLDVFTSVRDLLGKPAVKPRQLPVRPGEIQDIYLDISKARRILGWTPKVSLAQGAQLTVEYFKNIAAQSSKVA